MLFKHLVVGTMLALRSVSAIPHPQDSDSDIANRDAAAINDAPILEERLPQDHDGDDGHDGSGHSRDCGHDAWWDGHRCRCRHRDWDWDDSSRSCRRRHRGGY